MRRKLASEAADNGTVSERLLWHLSRSFNRQREEERDPALQALLFLITKLAESIGGGKYMPDRDMRLHMQKQWRTDLFQFRAFKAAVKKLLDALEEPPEPATPIDNEQIEEESAQKIGRGNPELTRLLLDIRKSPEALADFEFKNLWTRANRTNPLTESERRMAQKFPHFGEIIEREFQALPRAWKAANKIEMTADEKKTWHQS